MDWSNVQSNRCLTATWTPLSHWTVHTRGCNLDLSSSCCERVGQLVNYPLVLSWDLFETEVDQCLHSNSYQCLRNLNNGNFNDPHSSSKLLNTPLPSSEIYLHPVKLRGFSLVFSHWHSCCQTWKRKGKKNMFLRGEGSCRHLLWPFSFCPHILKLSFKFNVVEWRHNEWTMSLGWFTWIKWESLLRLHCYTS